ncbi:acetolactate synthase, partial [Haematococcus lacustris]
MGSLGQPSSRTTEQAVLQALAGWLAQAAAAYPSTLEEDLAELERPETAWLRRQVLLALSSEKKALRGSAAAVGEWLEQLDADELATVFIEQLDTKVLLLNNQHLGMDEADIYPDFVAMARSFGVGARRVIKKDECRAAIREMLDTPGPFLLEVMVPHIEHVLPMIPGGASFKDIITQGDGADKY